MTDLQASRNRPPRDLPFIHRLSNLLLDDVLARVRVLLFPFKLLTVAAKWASALTWELSNEYTKRSFGSCGSGVRLHGPFHVTAPRNLHIGDNVHINSNAFLRAEGGISIGDHTHISRNLTVYSMNHNYMGELLPYDSTSVWKPVKIGRSVWIGMNVSIAPGVEIGDGAIIGMGTVVAKDVPALAILGSAPQRVLKERDAGHYQRLDEAGQYSGMSGYAWKNPRAGRQ